MLSRWQTEKQRMMIPLLAFLSMVMDLSIIMPNRGALIIGIMNVGLMGLIALITHNLHGYYDDPFSGVAVSFTIAAATLCVIMAIAMRMSSQFSGALVFIPIGAGLAAALIAFVVSYGLLTQPPAIRSVNPTEQRTNKF